MSERTYESLHQPLDQSSTDESNTMDHRDTATCIKEALTSFAAQSLHIIDESPAHVGHSGRGAGGHFKLQIVSDRFQDKNLVQRHQMIYQALGDLMRTRIHALSIDARAPSEV